MATQSLGAFLLRAYLERYRASDAQFARSIEIEPYLISNYKSGKKRPGLEIAIKIEQKTGISVRAWGMDYGRVFAVDP